MSRDSSPWSAPAGRRHDFGHTDEGDYIRRSEPGHWAAGSGGHRSERGSSYGDWRPERGQEARPHGAEGPADRWRAGPQDRFGEPGDRDDDVPGRYQGGYRGGYGQGDQGAGGVQGSPQRSAHAGYPGMHEDPYAGAGESGSYSGPYTGHRGGHRSPRAPSYGRDEATGQRRRYGDSGQDAPYPGYSGEAWADRHWQDDHPGAGRPAHHDHDPDYHQWRTEQMRRLDEDYRLWRQDRYRKFSEDFDTWRSQREQQRREARQEAGGAPQQDEPQQHAPVHPQPTQQQQAQAGPTSVGAGPGERLQVSGIAGEPGAQNASPHEAAQAQGVSQRGGGHRACGSSTAMGGGAAPSRAAEGSSGDAGTHSPGNTGNTTTGGHSASATGSGNDAGKGLGG